MKEYYVDISHLSAEEKQLAHDKLDMMDFMTSYYFSKDNKLIGLVVDWTSKEDFGDCIKLLKLPFHLNYHEGDCP